MANIHTLQSIKGHRLGNMREQELEKKLHDAIKSKAEINNLSEKLQDKYIKRVKDFDRERKGWNREIKQWESAFGNVNSDKQKLHTHALELIGETKQLKIENNNLTSENIRKDLSLAESEAENVTKSKKIKLLESIVKILEGKLSSAQKDVISIQKDSLKKESEILSLKSKLAELDQTKDELAQMKDELSLKVGEVERLKLEAISQSLHDQVKFPSDKTIAGGYEVQENVPKVSNILVDNKSSLDTKYPAPEKSLRKYLRENIKMQLRKPEVSAMSPEIKIVDANSPDKDKSGTSSFKDDTLQNIEPIKIDVPSGNIPNSSLDKPNSGISVGGTEAIPAMTSVLGLPKTVWLLLVLFIIIVVWVKSIWKAKKKNENRNHTNTFLFN